MTESDSKRPSTFVTQLDKSLFNPLRSLLERQDFEFSAPPPYADLQAKKKGVSCTLYSSGKLVVQGKEMGEFIEFYLEPEILGAFSYTHPEALAPPIEIEGRIGIDESGKGDFFGPLCVAGVFAEGAQIPLLIKLGVKDSKALSDAQVLAIAAKMRENGVVHHVVRINPAKYNELYSQFRNLNRLLAWGHATVIEALHNLTGCIKVTIDQFAAESVVELALKRKKITLELTQRTKAEELPVVAAASIFARAAFLDGLERLRKQYGITLPKGASQATIKAGQQFIEKHGKEALCQVGKLHFKTYQEVLK